MLAPVYEACSETKAHPGLAEACWQSRQLWPAWHHRIESLSRHRIPFSAGPTTALIVDTNDEAFASAARAYMTSLSTSCSARLATDPEDIYTAFAETVRGQVALPYDGWIDSRGLILALQHICAQHDLIQIEAEKSQLESQKSGEKRLICAGWQSAQLAFRTPCETGSDTSHIKAILDQIRPAAGQMLIVAQPDPPIRTVMRWRHVYLVPRGDYLVIGATVEPGQVRQQTDPEAIADLKAHAIRLIPALDGMPVLQSWAGMRPATSDHAPMLGKTEWPDLYIAAGHYRNGILLAPLTAKWMRDLILDDRSEVLMQGFSPMRFAMSRQD